VAFGEAGCRVRARGSKVRVRDDAFKFTPAVDAENSITPSHPLKPALTLYRRLIAGQGGELSARNDGIGFGGVILEAFPNDASKWLSV
jgi:hypothetical protein